LSSKETPHIELPPPEADQPAWGKVGVIAIVGFIIGVAWPRLAGISLGPNPPADAVRLPAATATSPSAPGRTGAVPTTDTSGKSVPLMNTVGVPGLVNEQTVVVSQVEVSRCRDLKGKTAPQCDAIAVDPLFVPRLKELTKCPSAIGLAGKVAVGVELDFKAKTLKVQRAKAKLPRTTLDGLTRCVEQKLSGISLDDLTHEQARYSLSYNLDFYPPGRSPDASAEPEPPKGNEGAAGSAAEAKTGKVAWNSCQVRDAPRNGNVIGKLSKNTEIKLLEQKDGWWRVPYGDKGEGWIFGGALQP
jgi:hypothetical protein